MATTSKQRLALAICDFLSKSLTDGTLQAEEKDSIDVAINCVGEAFGVDPSDKAAVQQAVSHQDLLQIYSLYEKLKNGSKPAGAGLGTSGAASASAPASELTEEQKKQAEALKSKGNAAMAQKDYATAIDFYTQALDIHPGNAIYLSNRAAAHSAARDHKSAKADAEAAVAIDPKYTKAWSRLGLARFALGDAKGAMEAYKSGIEHEGNGGSDAMKKGYETAKRRVEELELEAADSSRDMGTGAGAGPDLSSLLGGMGGGGGGGMPDFASLMSNPMFASVAQNMMSSPDMMNNLMSNPGVREMANRFTNGGGMPDLASLMSDPSIAEMARNFGLGGGRGSGAGPGAGSGSGQ